MARGGSYEPLGGRLGMALGSVIDELYWRLGTAGWGPVRPLWGFVVVSLQDEPRSISEIGGLLGITKQAAAKVVDGLAESGLVRRDDDPRDHRATSVTLTPKGALFLGDARSGYAEIEAQWAAVIGARRLAALRADLSAVLAARYGDEPPPVRPVL